MITEDLKKELDARSDKYEADLQALKISGPAAALVDRVASEVGVAAKAYTHALHNYASVMAGVLRGTNDAVAGKSVVAQFMELNRVVFNGLVDRILEHTADPNSRFYTSPISELLMVIGALDDEIGDYAGRKADLDKRVAGISDPGMRARVKEHMLTMDAVVAAVETLEVGTPPPEVLVAVAAEIAKTGDRSRDNIFRLITEVVSKMTGEAAAKADADIPEPPDVSTPLTEDKDLPWA